MDDKTKHNALISLLLIIFIALACSSYEIAKANKLVDDANEILKDADKRSQDGLAKFTGMEAIPQVIAALSL
jgi:hypothetical protein